MDIFDGMVDLYNYIKPVIDIGLLSFILYKAYGIAVKTHGLEILKFLLMFFSVYVISLFLNLTTILTILNILAPGLLICFAIVFQPELRKIILRLLQTNWIKMGKRINSNYFDSVLIAVDTLSKHKRGMLIVFSRKTSLSDVIESGTKINADLSSALLVTIFGHDTPLHDGAVIIQGDKVVAAGCFLKLSEQTGIMKTFGTRHRAAIGVTEETDAIVLVVSEETGAASIAYDSQLHYDLSEEQLLKILEDKLGTSTVSNEKEVAL